MEIYFHLQGKKQGTAALAAPCRLLLAIFLLYPCYILQLLSLPRMAGGRQGFRFPVSISGSIFRFPASQPQAGHVTGMSSRSESFPSLPSPAPASRNAFGMTPQAGRSSAFQTPVWIRSTGTSSGGQVSFRWSRQAALSKPGSASMSAKRFISLVAVLYLR